MLEGSKNGSLRHSPYYFKQGAFNVNIVNYKLFPVRKITSKSIQAFIFYSIVWKLYQEDFAIYSVKCFRQIHKNA